MTIGLVLAARCRRASLHTCSPEYLSTCLPLDPLDLFRLPPVLFEFMLCSCNFFHLLSKRRKKSQPTDVIDHSLDKQQQQQQQRQRRSASYPSRFAAAKLLFALALKTNYPFARSLRLTLAAIEDCDASFTYRPRSQVRHKRSEQAHDLRSRSKW